jgi:hypothetical protein
MKRKHITSNPPSVFFHKWINAGDSRIVLGMNNAAAAQYANIITVMSKIMIEEVSSGPRENK